MLKIILKMISNILNQEGHLCLSRKHHSPSWPNTHIPKIILNQEEHLCLSIYIYLSNLMKKIA